MLKKSGLLFMLAILMVATFGGAASVAAQDKVSELTIWWAQWDPANYLQQIGNDYEKATGIKVNVVQTPWGTFQDRVTTEWAAKGTSFDLIVGDSQWVGQGATQGHYVDMTDFMVSNGIDKTVTPATLKYYGEYPADSGKYWGYPTEGDANGFAYRKDLFENPDEMAAFKTKYGYDLAVPETWAQLRDIAEFFTRPDAGLYGVNVYTQKDYDAITMGFENVFFSYGCNWQDETNNVLGVVNADACVKALELYKELYSFAPPGNTNSFFQEMNDSYTNGQAAMVMNYFAFLPALVSDTNKFKDVTGFFVMPKGPDGQQFAALGGQGMSINNYIDDAHKQAAFDFLKWFSQEDVQTTWADYGGYTCNINVLNSDKFLKATPYNAAFAQTMNFVKDFWNIPEFAQLLAPTQSALSGYVVGGQGEAKDVLDKLAEDQDKVLIDTGVIK